MDDSAILSDLGLNAEDEAFLSGLSAPQAASPDEEAQGSSLVDEWGAGGTPEAASAAAAATPPPRMSLADMSSSDDEEEEGEEDGEEEDQKKGERERTDDAGAVAALPAAAAAAGGPRGGGLVDSPPPPAAKAAAAPASPALSSSDEDDLFRDIPTMAVADDTRLAIESGEDSAAAPRARETRPEAFSDTRCRNTVSLTLFLAMSVVMTVVELVDLGGAYEGKRKTVFIVVMTCFVSAALGSVCLCVWVWVTPRRMWATQLASVCFVLGYGVMLLSAEHGSHLSGLSMLAVAAAMAAWLYRAADGGHLQFAAVLIEMVSSLVKANPAVVTVAAGVLLVQTLWLAIFSVAAYQATRFKHFGTFYLFLAAAFYWTTQVFKHVVHVSVSGTVAHWYFRVGDGPGSDRDAGAGADRSSVTYDSLRRACTTSLGSICFGSAFVSVVRWLWLPLRWCVETRWRTVRGAFRRPYELVDRLHSRFNKYAFRAVSMYGKDFRAASMDTWEQFGTKGVDSIVAEDRVDILLLLPCVGGGSFVALFCAAWGGSSGLNHWGNMATIAFFVGFATVSLTTEVVEAAVTALYACFAEQPLHLSETHPLIFHRFVRISEFSAFRNRRLQDDL